MAHDHDHDHPQPHGHGHEPVDFNRAFALGIALNTGFVAVEAWYGWLVNSLALLADAAHNLSDVAGLLQAWLAARPGVARVDDLHIWAMSTTRVALTAHLVLPAGHPGDGFLRETAQSLQQQFGIAHPTLQISREPRGQLCNDWGEHRQ